MENKKRITLDENVFLSIFQAHKKFGETALHILEEIEIGEAEGFISSINYDKVIEAIEDEETIETVKALLTNYPNLTIVPFDAKETEQTTSLQQKYQLSYYDAVNVATALTTKSTILVTGKERSDPLNEFIQLILKKETQAQQLLNDEEPNTMFHL